MFKTMGRVLLLVLVIFAAALLWRAFGPGSSERYGSLRPGQSGTSGAPAKPAIKGPDDDEEFLWNIEKNRFKERRAKEEAERKRLEAERLRREDEERRRRREEGRREEHPEE
ncbi:hypothetical protein CJEDD_01540 [Corynebacterium jeddahense]|uniref:Secreted protein n=2 Tax=Corynebacterium jeddahense TaxID=1414719 RepID=A0ABY7UJ49_9CORY|nr:hypothetical protein CJEDD_01540 [Corynebacterium jeddahense]